MVTINEGAVDVPGLTRMAGRLKRFNQSSSEHRIFMRLLRARLDFLKNHGLLVLINGDGYNG